MGTPSIVYKEAIDAMNAKDNSTGRKVRITVPPVGQPTFQETIASTQQYDRKEKKWKELTNSITYCIAKDCLPIHTVEGAGFKKIIATFDDIPSRNHFSRIALANLHNTIKQQVKEEVGTIRYFSSTTDGTYHILATPYTTLLMNGNYAINACKPNTYLSTTQELIWQKQWKQLWQCGAWMLLIKFVLQQIMEATSFCCKDFRLAEASLLRSQFTSKAVQDDSQCSQALGVCRKVISSFSMSWKRKRELTKAQTIT